MNDVGGSSGIRNATILMVFAGAFNLYLGYTSFQFEIQFPGSHHLIFGSLMIVFGFLTFCASLVVWLQKSWAAKIIAGIGVTVCITLAVFPTYLMILVEAPICWVAINQFRQGIVYSDWQEN